MENEAAFNVNAVANETSTLGARQRSIVLLATAARIQPSHSK